MTPLDIFHAVVIETATTFTQHRDELRDLRPSFWASLADLEFATDGTESRDNVIASFQAAYKRLGSPGDFGYGTPCGDALRGLYKAYSDYLAVTQEPAHA